MKRIVLLCGCLLVWGSAGAQLTLDSCRLLARNHYPEIRRYDLVRQTEEYTLSNARREWLPQLSLSAQATWQTAVPAFPDALTGMLTQYGVGMPGMNKDQYKVQLEVTQTIWDGGKSAADKRIAEAEAAEQRQATDVDLYALEGRVDDLYFGILLLDERVAQTKLTLGLLRSNLDKVRSLQRNGAAMQSDADAVEAELLTVEQQLAQVEASRESYRRMLELFIGEELAGRALVRPDVAEPASFEAARPELALFDAQAEKLAAQRRLVKSATRPRFGLFAQGYYGYPGMDYFESMMGTTGRGMRSSDSGCRGISGRSTRRRIRWANSARHSGSSMCSATSSSSTHGCRPSRRAATSPACAARWPTTTASCSCAVRCAKPQNRSSATG